MTINKQHKQKCQTFHCLLYFCSHNWTVPEWQAMSEDFQLGEGMWLNLKTGREVNDATYGVKVEMQQVKDDCHMKVLEHIQLDFFMAIMHGFGHAFDEALGGLLPDKHSDKDGLDASSHNPFG
jgi:hypothetical protein